MALGASRLSIVKQLLAESLVLAVIGGAAGVLLAVWGVELLINLNPDALPRADEISLDWRVLSFTMVLSLLTGVIFGIAPALQASRGDLISALKQGGLQGLGAVAGKRLRNALVVSEVALSLVLLIGAALLVKSFRELISVDAGFNAENVLTLRLRLPDARYRDSVQTTSFLSQVKQRVAGLPGVDSVSIATGFPLGAGRENGYWLEGEPQPQQPGDWHVAVMQSVDEDYYDTLDIGLVTGRTFIDKDVAASPPVVIVDRDFVTRHFPDSSPNEVLGKRLRFGGTNEPWREIVGVVNHVRHYGLDEQRRAQVYRPWLQMNQRWLAESTRAMDMIVKASVEPSSLISGIKREVQSLDKDQPLANVRTLEFLLDRSLAPRRFSLLVLSIFAIAALLLGCIGLYGVMSYTVSQSTREIGIRMALGAGQRSVLSQVLGEALKLTVAGLVIGIAGSIALTRLMRDLLFGVSPTDFTTFWMVSLALAVVALMASYFPARRATRVDPSIALRCE
jgi:putative ABC transport system permease protein